MHPENAFTQRTLIRRKRPQVATPDKIITAKSTGAKGQLPTEVKNSPRPNLNSFPSIITISPIYMTNVVADAAIDGIRHEKTGLLPYSKLPTYTPDVMPKRIKNMLISTQDIVER